MRRVALLALVLVLCGCGEKVEVGDSPVAVGHARKASEPEFAEKRAKHRTNGPPAVEGSEGVR